MFQRSVVFFFRCLLVFVVKLKAVDKKPLMREELFARVGVVYPFWEQSCPLLKAQKKMMFLFPRRDMLVPRRVTTLYSEFDVTLFESCNANL